MWKKTRGALGMRSIRAALLANTEDAQGLKSPEPLQTTVYKGYRVTNGMSVQGRDKGRATGH